MVDEAMDMANEEQLAICVRYVHPRTQTTKIRLLAFSRCLTSVRGEAIAEHILQLLTDWQLSPTDLRGQTYDGTGAMARKKKGAAARIRQLFPNAIYTHCTAHNPKPLCCQVLFNSRNQKHHGYR